MRGAALVPLLLLAVRGVASGEACAAAGGEACSAHALAAAAFGLQPAGHPPHCAAGCGVVTRLQRSLEGYASCTRMRQR
jgi:hypothetical protein